jgi:hypothetical protein
LRRKFKLLQDSVQVGHVIQDMWTWYNMSSRTRGTRSNTPLAAVRGQADLGPPVDKQHGGVLPAGLQVVGLVHHAVQLEARLPREVKDLWRVVVAWATCTARSQTKTDVMK